MSLVITWRGGEIKTNHLQRIRYALCRIYNKLAHFVGKVIVKAFPISRLYCQLTTKHFHI